MSHAGPAKRWLYVLSLAILIAGLVTLSVEARAWVGNSQHHLSKHYKIDDGAASLDAVIAAPVVNPLRLVATSQPLPPPVEFLPGDEPCLRSHLLRSPPSASR